MPNIHNLISTHNKSVIAKQSQTKTDNNSKDCNCRVKDSCPLTGKCLNESIVYQATVTREHTAEQKHMSDIRRENLKLDTIIIPVPLEMPNISMQPRLVNIYGN